MCSRSLVLLALLAACHADNTAPTLATDRIAGTYVLRSVSGEALPAATEDTPEAVVTVLAGDVRIEDNGFLVESNTHKRFARKYGTSTVAAEHLSASFDITGPSTFTYMRIVDGAAGRGTLRGHTLAIVHGDVVFEYGRQ